MKKKIKKHSTEKVYNFILNAYSLVPYAIHYPYSFYRYPLLMSFVIRKTIKIEHLDDRNNYTTFIEQDEYII